MSLPPPPPPLNTDIYRYRTPKTEIYRYRIAPSPPGDRDRHSRSFHLFPLLPLELRLAIWAAARPSHRFLRISLVLPGRHRGDDHHHQHHHHHDVVVGGCCRGYSFESSSRYDDEPHLRALLSATRESRAATLSFYRVTLSVPCPPKSRGGRGGQRLVRINPESDLVLVVLARVVTREARLERRDALARGRATGTSAEAAAAAAVGRPKVKVLLRFLADLRAADPRCRRGAGGDEGGGGVGVAHLVLEPDMLRALATYMATDPEAARLLGGGEDDDNSHNDKEEDYDAAHLRAAVASFRDMLVGSPSPSLRAIYSLHRAPRVGHPDLLCGFDEYKVLCPPYDPRAPLLPTSLTHNGTGTALPFDVVGPDPRTKGGSNGHDVALVAGIDEERREGIDYGDASRLDAVVPLGDPAALAEQWSTGVQRWMGTTATKATKNNEDDREVVDPRHAGDDGGAAPELRFLFAAQTAFTLDDDAHGRRESAVCRGDQGGSLARRDFMRSVAKAEETCRGALEMVDDDARTIGRKIAETLVSPPRLADRLNMVPRAAGFWMLSSEDVKRLVGVWGAEYGFTPTLAVLDIE